MVKETDWGPFCALMKTAANVCATEPKDRDALGMMFLILSPYTIEQVKTAVFQHFRTKEGKWFPTTAHIIGLIDGNEDDRAEIAWRTFRRAVERLGGYESVRFPNSAYHYAIRELGGWQRINGDFMNMTEKDLEFWGKTFKKLYLIGERNASWDNVPGYFPGLFETQNTLHGYKQFVPPVLEVTTGKKLDREALSAPKDTLYALLGFNRETDLTKGEGKCLKQK